MAPFDSVISAMGQQSRVLKEIQALLDHEAKNPGHPVKSEDVEALKTYVATMQTAVDTATALAKYYKDAKPAQPAAAIEKPVDSETAEPGPGNPDRIEDPGEAPVEKSTEQFRGLLSVFAGRYREVFRFDIAQQRVTFTQYENGLKLKTLELGNPFKLDVLSKSILSFFQPYSLANLRQKFELIKILRVLRKAVRERLEKKLGYSVSSMYVSSGQYYGLFLAQLFNLAYRVTFPDAPNLPAVYRQKEHDIRHFWRVERAADHNRMDEVIELTRQGIEPITALTMVYRLPNTPFVKRILGANPLKAGLLAEVFSLCRNYDYARRLYAGLSANDYTTVSVGDALLEFLRDMLPIYGEAGIIYLVERAKETYLADCVRLYYLLNEDNRRAIKTERVKLKDLHDWMARRYQLQTHQNIKFNVPEHIVKRLSMQQDRLKFFLPKESMELLEAGAALHNCVASYGPAMKNNSRWVVLVADDKGRLAACLEVQGKALVQAKIDRNKPVCDNAELNAAVLAWVREAKLEIKTNDLKVEAEAVSMAG